MKWAWLLAAAACGSTTSAPSSTTTRPSDIAAATREKPSVELVPRPPIDMSQWLPDFHDELRWPLTAMQHPSFEPSFAIADALAGPGVTWQQLCQRGAQNRFGGKRDLNEYLRGWCQALEGNVDDATDTLLPLTGSTAIANFDNVVCTDIANILANSGHANTAEHTINKHKITNPEILDLLAANYVEVGTMQDALLINQLAINTSQKTPDAVKCQRWTRHIALLRDRNSSYMAQMRFIADPTCDALYRKIGCWADTNDCVNYVIHMGWHPELSHLISAYRLWSDAQRKPALWSDVAVEAAAATGEPGGADLAVAAMENAERTSEGCSEDVLVLAREVPRRIELTPRPDLRDRMSAVRQRCITKVKEKYFKQ